MTDIGDCLRLAGDTGAFLDIELEMLAESLRAWAESPGGSYALVELREGETLEGFALMRREAEFTFDVTAFCLASSRSAHEDGARLLDEVEREALSRDASAIVRFEMSKRREKAVAGRFLAESGYALIGHIPDFYGPGDDYFMYAKHVSAARSES